MYCLSGYGVVSSGEAFKTSGVGVEHFSVSWLYHLFGMGTVSLFVLWGSLGEMLPVYFYIL